MFLEAFIKKTYFFFLFSGFKGKALKRKRRGKERRGHKKTAHVDIIQAMTQYHFNRVTA